MKMEPDHMHKRNILDVFFVLMLLLSVIAVNVSKVKAQITTVSVQPSSLTVGQEGVSLPTPPFTINITVQNVEDLYLWQIVLYYNSTILSTREDLIIVPPENIFKDKSPVVGPPHIENDSKGTFLYIGASLSGKQSGVTGSGVLCQINFTGQATGTSSLNLTTHTQGDLYTFLQNSEQVGSGSLEEIPISIVDGEVTVIGIEKPPSTITIDVNPSTVTVRSNVTVTGTIDPPRVGANVTIKYKLVPIETWDTLVTVQTDESSRYEYIWTTEPQYPVEDPYYTYELYAYWPGDENYTGATSDIASVTVHKMPSHISLSVYPASVTVGSNVTINGTISGTIPLTPPYENVTISYKREGGDWITLATVHPGEDGAYTYTWETDEGGLYAFKASWPGDKYLRSAESYTQVEVIGEAPDIMAYLYYIIAAIVIVIIAIGIYFTKIRKRSHATDK